MPPAHGGRPRSQVQVRQPDAEVSRLARLLSPHEMGRRVSSVLLPKNLVPRTCRPTRCLVTSKVSQYAPLRAQDDTTCFDWRAR